MLPNIRRFVRKVQIGNLGPDARPAHWPYSFNRAPRTHWLTSVSMQCSTFDQCVCVLPTSREFPFPTAEHAEELPARWTELVFLHRSATSSTPLPCDPRRSYDSLALSNPYHSQLRPHRHSSCPDKPDFAVCSGMRL